MLAIVTIILCVSSFMKVQASLMKWNESYTTLWKDCRKPGYTKSMVVHYKLKMIWCPNAKVGTTSMYDLFRSVLGTGEHLRCIKEFPNKCAPFVSMSTIPERERIKLCERGFLTFTFVRNPYERVLSAYLDKLGRCRVDKEGKTISEAPGYEHYCISIRKRFRLSNKEPVKFEHFIKWLSTRRKDEFNQHWETYRSRCATGNHMSAVHYDIVGKLESGMNTTLKILFDKLGIDASHYRHSGRNSNDAHAKLKMHYQNGKLRGKEIARLVHDIYKSDIYDFGYTLGF